MPDVIRHTRVKSDDIKDLGIKTKDLAANQVTEAKAKFLTQMGSAYTGSTGAAFHTFPTSYAASPEVIAAVKTTTGSYHPKITGRSAGSFQITGSPYTDYSWMAYGNK